MIQSPAVAPEHSGHEGAFASHGLVRQSVEGFGVVVDGHVKASAQSQHDVS